MFSASIAASGPVVANLLVEIRLKLGSNRHVRFLLTHLEQGLGLVLRASQASLNCRQTTQDLARPVGLVLLGVLITYMFSECDIYEENNGTNG